MRFRSREGRRSLLPLVATAACLATAGAQAQDSYTCRDHSGKVQTSDRPIPDCASAMRVLSPTGVVKREIAPPMSAEQVRQKEADDRARRVAEEAVREQHRRDTALLTAYQSEDQIEAARRRALADANESIKASRLRIIDLERDQKGLVQDGDAYKGKTMPPLVRRRIDDNQALIDDEEATIKLRQTDVERVNQRYDEEKNRFRALTATHTR